MRNDHLFMSTVRFGDVLEAVDQLSLPEQETLLEVVRRRLVEARRTEIINEVKSGEREFGQDQCQEATPADLMKEILE